jgi:nucleotide-binding universal stress UspA family protein
MIIIVIMAVSLPIEDVASAADIMFLLLFLQVNVAMIRLRKKRPDLDRGFMVPLYPYISILAILLLLFLAVYMFNYSPIAWLVTGVWIVVGLGVYRLYAHKRDIEHAKTVRAIDRMVKKEYRILVCLSDPKNTEIQTQIAIAVAKKHHASIIFLHVIEVGEGQPLQTSIEPPESIKNLLENAEKLAEENGISARSVIEVAHRISRGILETAEEEDCNFIVLGREKHPTFFDRVFSSLIDTVIQEARSEVAILHGASKTKKVKNVLLPFSGDIHTGLAAEIAPALIEHFGCKLRLLVVFNPETPETVQQEKTASLEKLIRENQLAAELKIVQENDILKTVVRQSRRMDLVVMGAHTGGYLELLLGNSLAQDITEQVHCPVLWLKEYEEQESFWKSIFKPLKKRT